MSLTLHGIIQKMRDEWLALLVIGAALIAGWSGRGYFGDQLMLPFTNQETLARVVVIVDTLDSRVRGVEGRLVAVEAKIVNTDSTFGVLDAKLDAANAGITQIRLELCLDRAATPEDRRRCARGGS